MSKDFREFDKESLEIRVPIDLATKIRQRAVRERSSISRVGTEAFSRLVGDDPSKYGIEAEQKQTA